MTNEESGTKKVSLSEAEICANLSSNLLKRLKTHSDVQQITGSYDTVEVARSLVRATSDFTIGTRIYALALTLATVVGRLDSLDG